jgi:spore coat protein CotH
MKQGEWQGLKKLNLNGEHNDPSVMRARLVWESFRDAGVPVSRSAHAQLHINGTYFGVYSTAEQLDGNWLDERFPYGHGNLWKCTYPADLVFLDTDPEAYKLTPPWSDQRIYELKTNEAQDDYSALAHFIDILNNTSDDEFPCELESVFDVEAYLKVLAGEILVGHWDNYVGNKNNFYLYERSFDRSD